MYTYICTTTVHEILSNFINFKNRFASDANRRHNRLIAKREGASGRLSRRSRLCLCVKVIAVQCAAFEGHMAGKVLVSA